MKTFLKSVLFLGLTGFLCQCTNDPPPECGCDAETVYPIPNEEFEEVYGIPPGEQITGKLFFKHPEIVDGYYDYEEYSNMFWISQGQKGCWNCRRIFIVCNEELIGEEFHFLKQQGVYDSIPIQFSGNVKRTCIIRHLPADMVYGRIQLKTLKNQ